MVAMALESLKYGNFRPQQVFPEARSLPGFGGDPTAWADYRFQVEALQAREEKVSDTERKKLGPLALRLVERLQGPALQVAKQLGVTALVKEDGTEKLMQALADELMPMRRQAALELYNAGMVPQGPLSRQQGESMSSYLLRREAWWNNLKELDSSLQVSETIMGEQTLSQSGLQPMEIQMVRTVCKNDLNKKNLYRALRDQFGQVHDREKTGKGYHKGYGRGYGKGGWQTGGKSYGYMATSEEKDEGHGAGGEEMESTYAEDLAGADWEDEGYQNDDAWAHDPTEEAELAELEASVVCWYAEQGISAQTCCDEDLNLIVDAVEAEQLAYYAKGQAKGRGLSFSAGGSSPYQLQNQMSPQERQSKVLAAKQRSRCRACNQMGHWKDDPICPRNKGRGKGKMMHTKGKFKDKGRGKKSGGSGHSSGQSSSPNKSRTVYFTVRDETSGEDENKVSYMALHGQLNEEDQLNMEREVQRLLRLGPAEVERQFRQELDYVPPTSKSPPVARTEGPVPTAMRPVPTMSPVPKSPQPKASMTPPPTPYYDAEYAGEVEEAQDHTRGVCAHLNVSRRGTNAYVDMETCKDCGKVLRKEKKEHTRGDSSMVVPDENCQHNEVTWAGSNGYVWRWTCKSCGKVESVKKTPGTPKPSPGQRPSTVHSTPVGQASSSSVMSTPPVRRTTGGDTGNLVIASSEDEWNHLKAMIDRLVQTHLHMYGSINMQEYTHVVNCAALCCHTFGATMAAAAVPAAAPPGSRSTTRTSGTVTTQRITEGLEDGRRMDFGAHKGRSFKEVYDLHPDYVDWALEEQERQEPYCAGMRRFQTYCRVRREQERHAYMALTDVPQAVEDGDEDADKTDVIYLDSGCNTTCHGELWMKKFLEKTGCNPEKVTEERRPLQGIGGNTWTTGMRLFYVNLHGTRGERIPGEISSTEVEGSVAPMLLSIHAQQTLGLVIDFETMKIFSKTLNVNFEAVRGERNGLLGIRVSKVSDEVNAGECVAMMAEGSSSQDVTSHEVREVPARRNDAASSSTTMTSSSINPRVSQLHGRPKKKARVDPNAPWRQRTGDAEDETEEVEIEEENDEVGDATAEPSAVEVEEIRDDGPNTEEEPEPVDRYEDLRDEQEDYWLYELEDRKVIRVHLTPRKTPYRPEGDRLDLPVDLDRIEGQRVTLKHFEDESTEKVVDNWRVGSVDIWTRADQDATTFQGPRRGGPSWDKVVGRKTYNLDGENELIEEERGDALREPNAMNKALPEGVKNIRTELFILEEYEDEKPWRGQTVFTIKETNSEQDSVQKYDLEQDQENQWILKKGQRKMLKKQVEMMETNDVAMWSTMVGTPMKPQRRRFVLEIFCGAAVLTRMALAWGYEACQPLDIQTGWDVHKAEHRKRAEETLKTEKPFLLTLAWPCGPWSTWRRMNDPEEVAERRKEWIPVLRWVKKMVRIQHGLGGYSLLENPWYADSWKEMQSLTEEKGMTDEGHEFDIHRVDLCAYGLKDQENKLPHLKPTGIGTDSPEIRMTLDGRCCGGHEHQPLEGSNAYGKRTEQAAQWTTKFCRTILLGAARQWEADLSRVAFTAEDQAEKSMQELEPFDEIYETNDLGPGLPQGKEAQEHEYQRLEGYEEIHREAEPNEEKIRKTEWMKLTREERVSVRRLHHMTSHATRPQLQRMLKYAGALPHIIRGVKFFRCSSCEKVMKEKKVPVVKSPNSYVFGEDVGVDVLEVKDAAGDRWHVLHVVCLGTTYHTADCLGKAQGVPASARCLMSFNQQWLSWAGTPRTISLDRGTHNRGVFQQELEKRGVEFRYAATESPHQIGRVERHGGVVKTMLEKVVESQHLTGHMDISLGLSMVMETKNNLENIAGFSPAQWVLGKTPRCGDGVPEQEEFAGGSADGDPQSVFNRRAQLRVEAREAWMQHDAKRRVRAALLRQGHTPSGSYQIGDMVSFMRKQKSLHTGIKWYGPARVLAQEGKNVWLLHGGVPMLIGNHMIRPSNPEELLEGELLNRKKDNKRRRGVLYEDVRQPHQFDRPEQQGFLDLREEEQSRPAMPSMGGVPPTEPPEDDSPKRMRTFIKEHEEEEQKMQQETAEDEVIDGILGPEVEDHSQQQSGLDQQPQLEMPAGLSASPEEVTDLQRAMRSSPDRIEGRMIRSSRSDRPGPYSQSREEDVDYHVRQKEFNCFLAKRTPKRPTVGGKNFRSETQEMQQKLSVTRAKEWESWKKYQATEAITRDEAHEYMRAGHKPIPLVWLDQDKNEKLRTDDHQVEEKLKSRMVMRGDMEEGSFRVDCPTASGLAIHLIVSYACCHNQILKSGDITAAFLQGVPIQRIVLLRAPADGIPGANGEGIEVEPGSFMLAKMSIYGAKDAPRGFWLSLRQEIVDQPEVHEVTGESALYAVNRDGKLRGYIATHVDDVLWNSDEVVDEVMNRVQQRFTFGSTEEGSFRYCGRTIEDTGKYIQISSPETLEKVKPIYVAKSRERLIGDQASPEEQSQMRGVLGSIGWIARLCRPELAYKTSALQGKQASPTLGDLLETNKLLQAAQKTKENGIRFYKNVVDWNKSVILSVTDASHAAELQVSATGRERGYRSQGGRFMFLANSMPNEKEEIYVLPLEWQSTTLKRICRSTLQAETLSSMNGSESAQHLRTVMYASNNPRPAGRDKAWDIASQDERTIYWLTDCRSLVDFMGSMGGSQISDKRLAIDLTTLRAELWRPKGHLMGDPASQDGMPEEACDQMHWISTKDMVSDGLTKSMKWDAIRKVLDQGVWKLSEAARRALPTMMVQHV